jgi:hypothetical protein
VSTIYRGKLKPHLFDRPTCQDNSERPRLRQKAKRDFMKHCRGDDGPFEVASADVLADAQELGDPFPEE